jgi:hypothetical protein
MAQAEGGHVMSISTTALGFKYQAEGIKLTTVKTFFEFIGLLVTGVAMVATLAVLQIATLKRMHRRRGKGHENRRH